MSHRTKEKFFATRDAWALRLDGIEMEFSDKKYWQEFRSRNKGFYATWSTECAEHVARVIQWYLSQGYVFDEVVNLAFLSIIDDVPNSVYGKTLSLLIDCWKYGQELVRMREEERPFK